MKRTWLPGIGGAHPAIQIIARYARRRRHVADLFCLAA
jgi:hypothetical protein